MFNLTYSWTELVCFQKIAPEGFLTWVCRSHFRISKVKAPWLNILTDVADNISRSCIYCTQPQREGEWSTSMSQKLRVLIGSCACVVSQSARDCVIHTVLYIWPVQCGLCYVNTLMNHVQWFSNSEQAKMSSNKPYTLAAEVLFYVATAWVRR